MGGGDSRGEVEAEVEDPKEGRVPNAAQPRILDIVILGGEWRGGEQWFVWRKVVAVPVTRSSLGGLATGASDRPRDKYFFNTPCRGEPPKGIPTCLQILCKVEDGKFHACILCAAELFESVTNFKIGNCFRSR